MITRTLNNREIDHRVVRIADGRTSSPRDLLESGVIDAAMLSPSDDSTQERISVSAPQREPPHWPRHFTVRRLSSEKLKARNGSVSAKAADAVNERPSRNAAQPTSEPRLPRLTPNQGTDASLGRARSLSLRSPRTDRGRHLDLRAGAHSIRSTSNASSIRSKASSMHVREYSEHG